MDSSPYREINLSNGSLLSCNIKRQRPTEDDISLDQTTASEPKRMREDKVSYFKVYNTQTNDTSYYFELSEKPCSVKHIESRDAFVVGTYELVDLEDARKMFPNSDDNDLERRLRAVNNRFGSLYLYFNTYSAFGYRELCQYSCESGGVFDLVLSNEPCRLRSSRRIYAAHANGTIGQYDIEIDRIISVGPPIRVVVKSSVLLTSIDCISSDNFENQQYLAVGDSDGNISLIVWDSFSSSNQFHHSYPMLREYQLIQTKVSPDPVWQVKISPDRADDCYVLVGADDSRWYFYKFNLKTQEFAQLYRNEDFQAGVTSLTFRSISSNCDRIRLFVGSYDETIREYTIVLDQTELVKVKLEGTMKIPGAGVWRIDYQPIKQGKGQQDFLNVATMYADPCRISIPHQVDNKSELNSLDVGELHQISSTLDMFTKEKPLYYGFVQSFDGTNHCILDFNNRKCAFIEGGSQYTIDDMKSVRSINRTISFALMRWLNCTNEDDYCTL